ncbi:MAG: phosphodiesterase [Promethearchaeota archaeon CR_4]|nr:MAG: phosphodiesterase [Candidatus Lokiarchaeota archaeon CR_4]
MHFLIIGDSHIPDRADHLPAEIQKGIESFKAQSAFDGIFFTGDFSKHILIINQLKQWAGRGFLKIVQGNMDEEEIDPFPIFDTYSIPQTEVKIGVTHGTQISPRGDNPAAEQFALREGVQILIIGHTHAAGVFLAPSGILILNPGSCVGAWSFIASGIPSFLILDIIGTQIRVTLYEKQQIELRKTKFCYAIDGKKIVATS